MVDAFYFIFLRFLANAGYMIAEKRVLGGTVSKKSTQKISLAPSLQDALHVHYILRVVECGLHSVY